MNASDKAGPRGPRGARGATGRPGRIGKRGPPGSNGVSEPISSRQLLDLIVKHFDDLHQQVNDHRKWIVQMQHQIAEILATLRKEQ